MSVAENPLKSVEAAIDVAVDTAVDTGASIVSLNHDVSLGQIILRFYLGIRDNTEIFEHLMRKADILLGPLLAPMLIICAGARLFEEMQNPAADTAAVLNILYVTGAVILLLVLYRTLLFQVTLFSNSIFATLMPDGNSFEGVMKRLEDVMQDFEDKKSHTNIVARWADKTLSLYSQYALAWTSKWAVMVLHGLLNYVRNLLYVINYVLGMFLLPLLILKNKNLPRNWFMITLFIFLWMIIEGVLVAAVGELSVSALKAAFWTNETMPAFATTIFYVMITTVNILVGLSLLAAIWILRTYFFSPGSIATMSTALALPAVAMARMMAGTVRDSGRMVLSGIPGKSPSSPSPQKQGGGSVRRSPNDGGLPNKPSAGKPGDRSSKPPTTRKLPKLRTIIEHEGALDRKALPKNVMTTSRVGRRHRLPSSRKRT